MHYLYDSDAPLGSTAPPPTPDFDALQALAIDLRKLSLRAFRNDMIQSLTADMGNMGIHPMHTLPVGNQRAAMEVELRNLSVNTLHTFSADNGNGALQRYPSRVDNMHIPVMHTFPAVHTFPVNIPANNGYNQVQSLSADMENLSLHTMPPLPVNNQKGPKAKKTVRFPDQRQKQLAKVGASTKSSKKKQAAEKQAIAARSSKDTSTTADSSDTEAPVPASMTMKAKPTKAIVLSNPHGQVIHKTETTWVYSFY